MDRMPQNSRRWVVYHSMASSCSVRTTMMLCKLVASWLLIVASATAQEQDDLDYEECDRDMTVIKQGETNLLSTPNTHRICPNATIPLLRKNTSDATHAIPITDGANNCSQPFQYLTVPDTAFGPVKIVWTCMDALAPICRKITVLNATAPTAVSSFSMSQACPASSSSFPGTSRTPILSSAPAGHVISRPPEDSTAQDTTATVLGATEAADWVASSPGGLESGPTGIPGEGESCTCTM